MATRNYERLGYKAFGRDLLDTFDLDPIYPMLALSTIDANTLKRWLLAYWCYYAAGPSSWVAEQKDFYAAMLEGMAYFPRGHERRHFRGHTAVNAINGLKQFGKPEAVVDAMTMHKSVKDVRQAVQQFWGFGPWISWKIADMAERVLNYDVDFSNTNLYIFKDPVKGAALVMFGDQEHAITEEELGVVIDKTLAMHRKHLAPPYLDRRLNVQEVETILCKWKSHMNGHYSLGTDSFEIAEGLKDWGDLASDMYKNLKQSTAYEV